MIQEEEILKNKAKIRLNEIRIKAIINLLSKEGILTHEEIEQEVKDLLNKSEDINDRGA